MSQNNSHLSAVDDSAEDHMKAASALLECGEWSEGSEELLRSAELHRAAGRPYDEARCLQMAASAIRAAGETAKARKLADQAASIRCDNPQLRLSILAEQAEGAYVDEDWIAGLEYISQAIDASREAHLKDEGLSALLRRRGRINLALGNLAASGVDYERAFNLHEPVKAGFVKTEQADALLDEDLIDEAEKVLATVPEPSDPHLAADLLVLRAKVARRRGQIESSIELAERARKAALEAVAPISYFASSVELAEALQSAGRFAEAYGAIARAASTLADLLGLEVAKTWTEPCLMGYQIRWGNDTFASARQAYEAKRRAEKETQ